MKVLVTPLDTEDNVASWQGNYQASASTEEVWICYGCCLEIAF